jgi:hypothetical protein
MPVAIGDVVDVLFLAPRRCLEGRIEEGVATALVEFILPPCPGEEWATLLLTVEQGTKNFTTTLSANMIVTVLS